MTLTQFNEKQFLSSHYEKWNKYKYSLTDVNKKQKKKKKSLAGDE